MLDKICVESKIKSSNKDYNTDAMKNSKDNKKRENDVFWRRLWVGYQSVDAVAPETGGSVAQSSPP